MDSMKKIIFCVTNDLNHDQRMNRICHTLAANGYVIELVGRVKRDSKPIQKTPYKQTRLNCYFEKGKMFYCEFNLRLFIYLLFKPFDIAGSVDLDTIIPVWLVAKIRNKKCSFDAHEYFEEVPEVTGRPIIKKIWTLIGNIFILRMDVCYTVGKGLAEIFSRKYGVPFSIIRNVPFKKDITSVEVPLGSQPYILYQGALNEGRGIEQMIEAMVQLPEYRLLIAGDGDLTESLIKKVKVLSLEKKILFLGNLSPAHLDGYTAGAYIGLNLLANRGLSYYHSLANKFFDYVQFGVPVITMDFPEYRALNEEHEVAVLLKDLDVNRLVLTLKSLHTNINLHQNLRLNGLKAAVEWNWQNESNILLGIYTNI